MAPFIPLPVELISWEARKIQSNYAQAMITEPSRGILEEVV